MPFRNFAGGHLRIVLLCKHHKEIVVKCRADLLLLVLDCLHDLSAITCCLIERANPIDHVIRHKCFLARQSIDLANRGRNNQCRVRAVLQKTHIDLLDLLQLHTVPECIVPGSDAVNPVGDHRPTRHQKRDFVIPADLQKHIGLRILEIVGLVLEVEQCIGIWLVVSILLNEHGHREIVFEILRTVRVTHRIAYNVLAELVHHLPRVELELACKLYDTPACIHIARVLAAGVGTCPNACVEVLQKKCRTRAELRKLRLDVEQHVVDIALGINAHEHILTLLKPQLDRVILRELLVLKSERKPRTRRRRKPRMQPCGTFPARLHWIWVKQEIIAASAVLRLVLVKAAACRIDILTELFPCTLELRTLGHHLCNKIFLAADGIAVAQHLLYCFWHLCHRDHSPSRAFLMLLIISDIPPKRPPVLSVDARPLAFASLSWID